MALKNRRDEENPDHEKYDEQDRAWRADNVGEDEAYFLWSIDVD